MVIEGALLVMLGVAILWNTRRLADFQARVSRAIGESSTAPDAREPSVFEVWMSVGSHETRRSRLWRYATTALPGLVFVVVGILMLVGVIDLG